MEKNPQNKVAETKKNQTVATQKEKKAKTEKAAQQKEKVQKEKTEKKAPAKREKTKIDMVEITKLITDSGVKVHNPDCKGNYRIFNSAKGSSLNAYAHEYRIYSTEDDFRKVVGAKIEGVETLENDNLSDKNRPHTVKVKDAELLKKLLKVYAA